MLGGSRARGTATATSDYDIGLYYRRSTPIDVAALQRVVEGFVDTPPTVTEIGAWGAWINGGGWLQVRAESVDLLYRDIDAVGKVIEACLKGHVSSHYQSGHPHGFFNTIWIGEIAYCVALQDRQAIIQSLKDRVQIYPSTLGDALVEKFAWEATFSLKNAEKSLLDSTYVAGCIFRFLACFSQVMFALNRRYLINEKRSLPEAATFSIGVPDLLLRVRKIWSALGENNAATAIEIATDLRDNMNRLISEHAPR